VGPDRGLIAALPITSSDPSRLGAWLAALPVIADAAEARAVAATVMNRVGAQCGVVPSALEPATHPLADSLPEDLLALDVPGRVWERLMAPADRRRGGSHYTPYPVARHLVDLAVAQRDTTVRALRVVDPASGAGVFLLAAAEALSEGEDRAEIVERLWGFDVDQTALDLADAMLEIWSGGRARPEVRCLDVLVDEAPGPEDGFDLVVGNPPFLGQLTHDTSRSEERRRRLAQRFGGAASGYVDDAAVFLRAASELVAPGGVVVLIQPQSVLGAAHARGVRAALAAELDLAALWVEDGSTFEAGVDVCAPVLVRRPPTESVEVVSGHGVGVMANAPKAESWSPLLAAPRGLPPVELVGEARLGDIASATAGFRQHFYGIADAVREAPKSEPTGRSDPLRLVTAGAIDPFDLGWGSTTVRFAGRRWTRPLLDLDRADPDVAVWFSARIRPKVLVASQTRVVEAVIDREGTLMPSVPVVSVEPDETDVALVAAVLAAPPVSAYLASVAAGTGLSSDTIRVSASALAEIPLPVDGAAWREGAEHGEAAQVAMAAGDAATHQAQLRLFGEAMTAAYAQPAAIADWWWGRLRFRA